MIRSTKAPRVLITLESLFIGAAAAVSAFARIHSRVPFALENMMGEPIKAASDKVFAAASEAKLLIVRPTMLVYKGGPHVHFDAEKNFKMEIGVIVGDDTKLLDDAGGDLKVRKTEAFKCATILYTGEVNQQGKAYEKLIPAMNAAGLTPTGEEREMCLYWVGEGSLDNVFMMQIGIK
jgi:effector-binding domain-containing protein